MNKNEELEKKCRDYKNYTKKTDIQVCSVTPGAISILLKDPISRH